MGIERDSTTGKNKKRKSGPYNEYVSLVPGQFDNGYQQPKQDTLCICSTMDCHPGPGPGPGNPISFWERDKEACEKELHFRNWIVVLFLIFPRLVGRLSLRVCLPGLSLCQPVLKSPLTRFPTPTGTQPSINSNSTEFSCNSSSSVRLFFASFGPD